MAKTIRYVGFHSLFTLVGPPLSNQKPFSSIKEAANYLRKHGANGPDLLVLYKLANPLHDWDTERSTLGAWTPGHELRLVKGPRGGISGGGL